MSEPIGNYVEQLLERDRRIAELKKENATLKQILYQTDRLSETEILMEDERLRKENAALMAKIADYESGWRSCMDDNDGLQHCTCVPALKIRVRELTAMLKAFEWGYEEEEHVYLCPICAYRKSDGHAPTCALAALLKGADDANPAETA